MRFISTSQKIIISILSVLIVLLGLYCFLNLLTEEFIFIITFLLFILSIIIYFIIDDDYNDT